MQLSLNCKIKNLLLVSTLFLYFFAFLIPKTTKAGYDASTNTCFGSGCTLERATVCEENGKGPVPSNFAPSCVTEGTDIWTFYYPVCNVCAIPLPGGEPGEAQCDFRNYEYATAQCNSADRCYGSDVGGTGYDPATPDGQEGGRVLSGHCSEASFDGIDPSSACPSGGVYKRCCSSPNTNYPTTDCRNGICPDGQITASSVMSCSTAPPPEPPPPGPSGPSLTTFEGFNPTGEVACFKTGYKASLSWEGNPFDTGSCGSGFWVDVDNDSNWGNGAYHKCVSTSSASASTTAPDGFNGFGGLSGSFTFNQGQTYYARVYNGSHSNTLSLDVPADACTVPDTEAPTCEGFTLNGKNCRILSSGTVCETVNQGTPVNIGVSTDDNVKVSTIQLFKDGPPAIQTFNNTTPDTSFGIVYGFNTSSVSPGTYTMIANASDTSPDSPDMLGNDANCKGILKINPPPPLIPTVSMYANPGTVISGSPTTLTWTIGNNATSCLVSNSGPPTITPPGSWSGTLSGSDVTNGSHTRPITLSVSGSCQNKNFSINCTNSSGTSSTSSTGVHVCPPGTPTISTPVTWSKTSSSVPWPATFPISGNATEIGNVQIKPGSWSPGACANSLLCDGWTVIRSSVATGAFSFNWNPNSLTINPGLTYTFGLFDGSPGLVTRLLATATTNFIISASPPPGGSPPPTGPTPTAPPSCNPQEPPNNAPTVTLNSDGHTVDIVYQYSPGGGGDDDNDNNDIQGVSTQRITPDNPIQNIWLKLMDFFKAKLTYGAAAPPDIRGEIYRSDKRGFIDTSISKTQTGTQFGSYGHSFDRDPPSQEDEYRIAYYQLQAQSGTQTSYSNTSGALINEEGDKDCDLDTYSNLPKLQSAAQTSSTAETVTFDLIYKVFPRIFTCGSDPCTPSHTPPYLQIQRLSATTPGYIDWDSATSRVNTANKENNDDDIIESTWKATYIIDLPPETTENLTITGYHADQCDRVAKIGTVTLNNASTQPGTPPPIITPRLSTKSMARDKEKEPFVPMSWGETQNGQVVKSYRSSNQRWGDDNYVKTKGNFENGKWVFRATDDLNTLTAAKTYYYGIQLNMKGVVGTQCSGYDEGELVQSDQAGIYWDYKPWIKTTSGDVHSQEGINTPGGP